jgi:hypothetical protein
MCRCSHTESPLRAWAYASQKAVVSHRGQKQIMEAENLPALQHPSVGTSHHPNPAWGLVITRQGLGGVAGALSPWPLAARVVLRHHEEVDVNL